MRKSVYLSSLLVVCLSFLTISARAQVPVVTTDPISDTVCNNDTAYFHIAATGATPLTFLWQTSTDGGTMWDTVHDGSIYFGGTNDTLRIIPHYTHNGNMYRCLAFNTAGSDTSMAATLKVDTAFAGTISGMMPLCVGSSLTLSSSVAGGTWSNWNHAIDTVSPFGVLQGRMFGADTVFYSFTNTCGTNISRVLSRIDTTAIVYPVTGPTHVCVGNVITFANVNVVGAGVWTTAAGNVSVSSTGSVTGVAAGTDIVTYTFTNGCNTVTSWKGVTVEVLPAAGAITGIGTICSGTWTHLTSSVTGGIWLSGAPSVAVVDGSGNVTGVSQGASIISYYQSNSCGASFSTHTMTIEVPSGTITGNDSVGIDSTLLMGNTTPGGTWMSADTTIAKFVTADLIRGMDTGVTTVTYTVTNTCGTSHTTSPMHVGPLPDAGTIPGFDSVCVGGTLALMPTVPGGTWATKQDTLSTIDIDGIVSGVKFGKDTIVYTVTTAFGSKKVTKPIFVNDRPDIVITGPNAVSFGGTYNLKARPYGGTWTSSNTSMALITSTVTGIDSAVNKSICWFVVLSSGSSVFTYTATNTCGTSTKTFAIELLLPGAVNNIAETGVALNVFPNPSNGAVSVNIAAATNEKVTVKVTNIAGQVVKELSVMTNAVTDVRLDQPSGIYMLTAITADGQSHTARISLTN